jgi:hypothetical protein
LASSWIKAKKSHSSFYEILAAHWPGAGKDKASTFFRPLSPLAMYIPAADHRHSAGLLLIIAQQMDRPGNVGGGAAGLSLAGLAYFTRRDQ